MKESKATTQNPPDQIGRGFRISGEPVVKSHQPPPGRTPATSTGLSDLPISYGVDLLYVIARDPKSLFLYWDLDWTRVFADASLEPRQVHLRVFRADGTEETTTDIDPFRSHCFVEVSSPGARYYCELGCFAGREWRCLLRSGTTATPDAEISANETADFATLPFHLSFQRLIDIFRASQASRKTLAHSIAGLQKKTRALQESMAPADWSRLVEAAAALVDAEAGFGLQGVRGSDFAAFLRAELLRQEQSAPSPEMLERWRQFGERFGASSWGGSSGSSPA